MSYALTPQRERTLSGVLAVAMHVAFFALIVFGVTWQKSMPSAPVMADLWSSLPSAAPPEPVPVPPRTEPEPAPPPPVEKAPPPPTPAPRAEPKAPPKAEVAKPDIALKEKLAKEKAEKAAKEKAALEEKAKADARKREEEQIRLAALKADQAKADAARVAREQAEVQRRLAEQQAAAQAKLVNEYVERIKGKVRRFVVPPPNLQGNPEAVFDVVLLPGGEVLSVKLKKSSGVPAYDVAVERGLLKAQPLPLPPDPQLFAQFRELELKFRLKD